MWPKHLKPVAWHRDSEMVRMKLGLYHSKGNVRSLHTCFERRAVGNNTNKPTSRRRQRQNECPSRLATLLGETCALRTVRNKTYMHDNKYRFATYQYAYCRICLPIPCSDPGTRARLCDERRNAACYDRGRVALFGRLRFLTDGACRPFCTSGTTVPNHRTLLPV